MNQDNNITPILINRRFFQKRTLSGCIPLKALQLPVYTLLTKLEKRLSLRLIRLLEHCDFICLDCRCCTIDEYLLISSGIQMVLLAKPCAILNLHIRYIGSKRLPQCVQINLPAPSGKGQCKCKGSEQNTECIYRPRLPYVPARSGNRNIWDAHRQAHTRPLTSPSAWYCQ